MSVEITSAGSGKTKIVLDNADLSVLLNLLAQAKFGTEVKSYVLLAPLVNELFRRVIEYSDANSIRESGSIWNRTLSAEDALGDNTFASTVMKVLVRDVGEVDAERYFADAIYPNRLADSL